VFRYRRFNFADSLVHLHLLQLWAVVVTSPEWVYLTGLLTMLKPSGFKISLSAATPLSD
jgi:hypothetical protein